VTPLKDHLDDLADDVHNVYLGDRVHAASRRVTVRRRIAVSSVAAAVAAVAAVALVGLPLRHEDRGAPPEVAPTLALSPAPAPAPATPVAWDALPPTFYYQVAHPSGDGLRYDLWWWAGTQSEVQFTAPGPACGMFLSPDQLTVAWVAADGTPGHGGDLWVSGLDGNLQRKLLTDVTCSGLDVPRWAGPGELIARQAGTGRPRWIDVGTGKSGPSPFGPSVTDLVWSPDGRTCAYSESDRIVVVCRPDGSVIRRVAHGDETPTGGFSLQGISDDGRQAVLGLKPNDPGQVRTGFRLMDTVTGKNLTLPEGVELGRATAAEIHPVPGGQLLVRVDEGARNRIYLIGVDGTILDSRVEPDSLHNALLLPPTSP
jgi:hypothetical protein